MAGGQKELIRTKEAKSKYSIEVINILQQLVRDTSTYYARCKKAAILYDWVNGVEVNDIEKQYSTTLYIGSVAYGDIRKCADTTRFHLRSVYQIANVMNIQISEDSMEKLLRQLEIGIPEDSLELLSIPITLERGEYLALRKAGINTVEQLKQLSFDRVSEVLGEIRSRELQILLNN